MIQSGRQSHHLKSPGIFVEVVPDAVNQKSLAAWAAACTDRAVRSAVKDDYGDEDVTIVISHDHGGGTPGLSGG